MTTKITAELKNGKRSLNPKKLRNFASIEIESSHNDTPAAKAYAMIQVSSNTYEAGEESEVTITAVTIVKQSLPRMTVIDSSDQLSKDHSEYGRRVWTLNEFSTALLREFALLEDRVGENWSYVERLVARLS